MDEIKNESVRFTLQQQAQQRKKERRHAVVTHISAAKEAVSVGNETVAIQHMIIALDGILGILRGMQ